MDLPPQDKTVYFEVTEPVRQFRLVLESQVETMDTTDMPQSRGDAVNRQPDAQTVRPVRP